MPKRTDETGTGADSTNSVSQFEDAMKELEAIVQKMERGDMQLEESIKVFERGMALTQVCRQSLETAELKVKTLMDKSARSEAEK